MLQLFPTPTVPGTASVLTADQQARKKAVALALLKPAAINLAASTLSQIDRASRQGMNSILANPEVTPAEALAALGPAAAQLLSGLLLTFQYLAQQYAIAGTPYTPPTIISGLNLVSHPDGTVTVG